MARRLDRRVQRTRKMLRESLLSLILEEGYDEISIQDITDKANLGRATFYLHFKDKDELLLEVMDQLMEDILEQVPQLSGAQWRLEDIKAITKLFDLAAEHYDLYRILIIGSGGITASHQLQQSIASSVAASIQAEIETKNAHPEVPVEFIANHFAGSLLSTIYWWLDSDLPYSAEDMAAMFQKVNQVDRETLLGLNKASGHEKPDKQKEKRKKRQKEQPIPEEETETLTNDPADEEDGEEPGITVEPEKE